MSTAEFALGLGRVEVLMSRVAAYNAARASQKSPRPALMKRHSVNWVYGRRRCFHWHSSGQGQRTAGLGTENVGVERTRGEAQQHDDVGIAARHDTAQSLQRQQQVEPPPLPPLPPKCAVGAAALAAECPLCMNPYSDSDTAEGRAAVHVPRIITGCGHTACEACIANILTRVVAAGNHKMFRCPSCSVITPVLRGKAQNLKKNFLVLEMIAEHGVAVR